MTTRIRRTAEQIANDLEARARVARTKVKNMERAKQTRTAIIAGEAIRAMVNSGHANANLVWDEMLAGLKRDQDRKAFDLEPLPEPDNQPAANSSEPEPESDLDVRVLKDRVSRAIGAWNAPGINRADVKPLEDELVDSVVALEKATGKCYSGIKDRSVFGLSDRPGELARAS
jgi:hypothetical protein